jgi:hypothetical protein
MAILGYALMLIAMTYVVVTSQCYKNDLKGYFFAICLGLAIGEFAFGRFYSGARGSVHCG